MTHTALCHTGHRPCRVAKYLDFLIPISIRPYLTHTRRTVLLPCSDRVDMDRFKSYFSRSRHSICVCVCVWEGGGGWTNLPSSWVFPANTRIFTNDCSTELNASNWHARITVLYVWIDYCCGYTKGRETLGSLPKTYSEKRVKFR
jgi:hypothetical protein